MDTVKAIWRGQHLIWHWGGKAWHCTQKRTWRNPKRTGVGDTKDEAFYQWAELAGYEVARP